MAGPTCGAFCIEKIESELEPDPNTRTNRHNAAAGSKRKEK